MTALARNLTAEEMAMHSGNRRELPDPTPAERSLLGAIMTNPTALERVPSWFRSEYFNLDAHALLFDKAVDLIRDSGSASPVLLKAAIPNQRVGDKTVSQYLSELYAEAMPIAFVPNLCEAIYNVWRRRQRIISGEALKESAFLDELDLPDQIDDLRVRFEAAVENAAKEADRQSAGAAYLSVFEASAAREGVVGVPVALPELAKVLNEPVFEAGNLYGLLSSSGEGKSSLTMQLIYHAVKEGHPVLFLSYDQSAAQCVRQMIAQVHGIDIRQQRDPAKLMKQTEQDTCVNFAMWIDNQPLDIIRCQREGVGQLVAYAKRFIKKRANGKTPFIVIDHIGKVKARDPRLSPDRISGEVTVELKAMADETQSAVLILNQRNSEGTKRMNPRPISRDLYGGEGAKQDYDAVAYLYRPEKYRKDMLAIASEPKEVARINAVFSEFGTEIDTVAEVGVIKCRFGDPNVKEWLKFEARYTRYVSNRPPVSQERMI